MQINSREQLGEYLNYLNLIGLGAEIGVAYGHNSKSILSTWKGYGLFLIDPYSLAACGEYIDGSANIDFDKCLEYCRTELKDFQLRTIHIRDTSDNALKLLTGTQLDFVYIDGNHHNPQISKDLHNYWNLVKPGGLLCGHDYYDLDTPHYRCEVKSSVDKFLTTIKYDDFFYTPECSSWYILKCQN
jgi:SAM-dependent methyltransferase